MNRNEPPTEIDAMIEGVRRNLGIGDGQHATPSDGAVSMDVVMRRVNSEVARRLARSPSARGESERQGHASGELPRWQPSAPRIAAKREYTLHELLACSDADFVETAYRTVLRRPPDAGGLAHHVNMLRSGELSKVEVLAALRWSTEGEARGVHVDGLLAPYLLQKWKRKKYIGPVIAWCQALASLGRMPARIAVLDAAQARESQEIGRLVNHLGEQLEQKFSVLQVAQDKAQRIAAERADGLGQEVGQLAIRFDEQMERASSLLQDAQEESRRSVREKVDALASEMARTLQDSRRQFAAEIEARIDPITKGLDIALARSEDRVGRVEFESLINEIGAVVAGLQVKAVAFTSYSEQANARLERLSAGLEDVAAVFSTLRRKEEEASLRTRDMDPLYAAFEDRFRGERSLVRARAEPYVELVKEAGAGSAEAPVLDVGCGRGEWLELLRDNGLAASGIDLNRVFIEACRGRGLSVVEADAIDAMSQLAEASVGALTSMHLVEHLEFETLVAFLDQAHRVLRPGGLILLETPNPENLSVASHWFYMDPTHRNPLPPEALRWLVEARGFEMARIERQTVARELYAPPLVAPEIPGAASLNVVLASLNAAPDYAIVARRGYTP